MCVFVKIYVQSFSYAFQVREWFPHPQGYRQTDSQTDRQIDGQTGKQVIATNCATHLANQFGNRFAWQPLNGRLQFTRSLDLSIC